MSDRFVMNLLEIVMIGWRAKSRAVPGSVRTLAAVVPLQPFVRQVDSDRQQLGDRICPRGGGVRGERRGPRARLARASRDDLREFYCTFKVLPPCARRNAHQKHVCCCALVAVD